MNILSKLMHLQKTFLNKDPANLRNSTAAKNGHKIYTDSDTSITGNNNWANVRAMLIPYVSNSGQWFLKIFLEGTSNSVGSIDITIANTAYDDNFTRQPLVTVNQGSLTTAGSTTARTATDTLELRHATAGTTWVIQGEVSLAAKPSWVD